MSLRSKWQSLPTEAINPATLAIDKLAAADIVELMLNEDRKMLAAVQREKERIAVGVDIIAAGAAARAAASSSSARAPAAGSACSSRRRCRRRSAPSPSSVQAIMAGGQDAMLQRQAKASRTTTKKARASISRLRPDQEGRRHRRVGERHDAVRARRR